MESDGQDAQGEPHVVVRGQLLAVPRKVAQDLKVPRCAPHRRRNRIGVRQGDAAPPGCPPVVRWRVRADGERTDVSCALGPRVEHVEGADALGGAAQDDAGIECRCECIGDS